MPRFIEGSWGVGRFIMGEVPLYRVEALTGSVPQGFWLRSAKADYRGTSLIINSPPPLGLP